MARYGGTERRDSHSNPHRQASHSGLSYYIGAGRAHYALLHSLPGGSAAMRVALRALRACTATDRISARPRRASPGWPRDKPTAH